MATAVRPVASGIDLQACEKRPKSKIAQNVVVAAAAFIVCTTSEAAEPKNLVVSHGSSTLANLEENDSKPAFMMAGMSAKNFDPTRYAGRWFEVASLKRGFAGQGQEDCHCTQGVYRFDEQNRAIQVDTFCVHGSPDGFVTGIRGKVQCSSDSSMKSEAITIGDNADTVSEKCFLRFPTLPFIPKEPYDVIATDYTSYALVSGAKDTSFVQIYSRTPNPGREFIDKYKAYLGEIGYDAASIKDTPQDCQEMSMDELSAMMAAPGMEQMMTNTFYPPLGLTKSVEFNPFTSLFDTLKQLVKLYFS